MKAAEIVKSMVKDADVFIESFRPGVIQRLGLSYDVLSKINPRLIYCSVSAFGQHGPFSAKAGYDIVAQAYSGLIYYTGEADGDPMKVGFSGCRLYVRIKHICRCHDRALLQRKNRQGHVH